MCLRVLQGAYQRVQLAKEGMMAVFKRYKTASFALLHVGGMLLLLAFAVFGFFGAAQGRSVEKSRVSAVFARPTNSSPIVLNRTNTLLWVVSPDDDTVAVIHTNTNRLIKKIVVGDEPQSVAVDPNDQFAYVANAASNTVTVIRIFSANPVAFDARVDTTVGVNGQITTGAEPWNIVISPDGKRVFVANSGQDTITVINAENRTLIGSVNLRTGVCNQPNLSRHFQPRGMAISLDSKRLYVTRFLSFTKAGGLQGTDLGKEGTVCRLNIDTNALTLGGYVAAAGIKLAARPAGFNDANNAATSAFPNQMQSIVIRGNQAYLPNIAASPTRPLKFNVDTHAFVNVLDNVTTGTPADASGMKMLNLHLGARNPEPGKTKLFFPNPWAIAFNNNSGTGTAYVASAGSDVIVKLNVAADGDLNFTVDADTTRYIDLNDPANPLTRGARAGKNPLGIVVNNGGSVAYTMNYVSRNVTVIRLSNDTVVTTIKTGEQPTPFTQEEVIQVGKEMFFSSRGHFNRPGGTTVSTSNRLSSEGWQNCASCHFQGLTDGVVWQFGTGPRKSVPMNATWNPHNPNDQRLLNYSAIFDEVQDFEANIRNVSGPGNLPSPPAPANSLDPNHGLIFGNTINDAPAAVPALLPIANAGRPQHTVTLPGSTRAVPALDALKEWVRFGIRSPNGALTTAELAAGGGALTGGLNAANVAAGRTLFYQANCQSCHGSGKWSSSVKDFNSPPNAALVDSEIDSNGATAPNPNAATFLFGALRDIKSFGLNVPGAGNTIPGQPEIGAVEIDTAGRDALGKDHDRDGRGEGFNPGSLLAIDSVQPFYHNGACETLRCVLSDPIHRRSGLAVGAPDPLDSQVNRDNLELFLRTIDTNTPPPHNLRVLAAEISTIPAVVNRNTTVTVRARVRLTGPRVPIFTPGPIRIAFFDGQPGTAGSVKFAEANMTGIPNDNGALFFDVPWNVPNVAGNRTIFVVADFSNLFFEDNETDNTASKVIAVQ